MKKCILIFLLLIQGMVWGDEIREVPVINMQRGISKIKFA